MKLSTKKETIKHKDRIISSKDRIISSQDKINSLNDVLKKQLNEIIWYKDFEILRAKDLMTPRGIFQLLLNDIMRELSLLKIIRRNFRNSVSLIRIIERYMTGQEVIPEDAELTKKFIQALKDCGYDGSSNNSPYEIYLELYEEKHGYPYNGDSVLVEYREDLTSRQLKVIKWITETHYGKNLWVRTLN